MPNNITRTSRVHVLMSLCQVVSQEHPVYTGSNRVNLLPRCTCNSTEFLGESFENIFSKIGPPDPPRPQMRIFLWESAFCRPILFGWDGVALGRTQHKRTMDHISKEYAQAHHLRGYEIWDLLSARSRHLKAFSEGLVLVVVSGFKREKG